MKISISVPGRFHAFELARELQRHGVLHCLVTSQPAFKVTPFGIEKIYIKSIISKEIIVRGWKKLFGKYPNWFWINEWYDKMAAHALPMDSDIYILWAGFSLHTIKRIRKKNPKAKIILERGSTHIQFQYDILVYAYNRELTMPPVLPSNNVIRKEIEEYTATDFIAIPTSFVEKTFVEKGINIEKLFINPYGVDLSLFKKSEIKLLTSERLNILFVGLFSIQKGASVILEVINKFIDDERITFSFVGGMEKGLLDKLETHIINKKVFYQPSVPQNQLPKYYSKAEIFLFPSYQEGLAIVLLQAMASGLCVIASENSGAGMVIRDMENGIIIPHNPEVIVNQIKHLIDDRELLLRLRSNARSTIENGFTWVDYGNRAIKFYSQIV